MPSPLATTEEGLGCGDCRQLPTVKTAQLLAWGLGSPGKGGHCLHPFAQLPLANPPELLLHEGSRPATLPPLATFFVAAVELLDQHSGSPALLEFLLLIIASEFALDQNGSLNHLLIKCILQEGR